MSKSRLSCLVNNVPTFLHRIILQIPLDRQKAEPATLSAVPRTFSCISCLDHRSDASWPGAIHITTPPGENRMGDPLEKPSRAICTGLVAMAPS